MAAHIDVHRRVGLGELCWGRDALITERRRWRPGDHRSGHVGAVVLLNTQTTGIQFSSIGPEVMTKINFTGIIIGFEETLRDLFQ